MTAATGRWARLGGMDTIPDVIAQLEQALPGRVDTSSAALKAAGRTRPAHPPPAAPPPSAAPRPGAECQPGRTGGAHA